MRSILTKISCLRSVVSSPSSVFSGQFTWLVKKRCKNWFAWRNISLGRAHERRRFHSHATQLAQPPQEVGRPAKLEGILRHLRQVDLSRRLKSRADRRGGSRCGPGDPPRGGEENAGIQVRPGDWLVQELAFADHATSD